MNRIYLSLLAGLSFSLVALTAGAVDSSLLQGHSVNGVPLEIHGPWALSHQADHVYRYLDERLTAKEFDCGARQGVWIKEALDSPEIAPLLKERPLSGIKVVVKNRTQQYGEDSGQVFEYGFITGSASIGLVIYPFVDENGECWAYQAKDIRNFLMAKVSAAIAEQKASGQQQQQEDQADAVHIEHALSLLDSLAAPTSITKIGAELSGGSSASATVKFSATYPDEATQMPQVSEEGDTVEGQAQPGSVDAQ